PYQTFAVADGHVIITVGNSGQFQKLCAILGLPDLGSDPRFATNADRVQRRDVLIPVLEAAIAVHRRDELLAVLAEAGVPAGPINTVADVFADPQIVARDMVLDLERGDGSSVPTVRSPIRFSESELALGRASPGLGEHSAEIKAELADE
ncbi:MAG: CoA transferase, partial [Pseudomonadota bacterium]